MKNHSLTTQKIRYIAFLSILAILTFLLTSCELNPEKSDAADFIKAVKLGNLEQVNDMMEKKPELANKQDRTGRTALHWAVVMKRKDLVSLLANPVNITLADNRGYLPIDYARFDDEMVKTLITHGSSEPADWKYAGIYRAIEAGNVDAVRDFIRKDPESVRVKNEAGETILMYAVSKEQHQVAAFLILKGAGISDTDKNGVPVLKKIAHIKYRPLIESALSNSFDINTTDSGGKTLLHHAVENRDAAITSFLISSGASMQKADSRGNLPLHYAVTRETAETLIKSGADIKAKNARKETLLHTCISSLPDYSLLVDKRNELAALRIKREMLTSGNTTAPPPATSLKTETTPPPPETPNKPEPGTSQTPSAEDSENQTVSTPAPSPTASAQQTEETQTPKITPRPTPTPSPVPEIRPTTSPTRIPEPSPNDLETLRKEIAKCHAELTAMETSVKTGRELVEYLVSTGIPLNEENIDGDNPLRIARKKGYRELVEYLVKLGATG